MTTVTRESIAFDAHVALASARTDPGLLSALTEAAEKRWAATADVTRLASVQARLPQLPEQKASEVYEQLDELERLYAAPHRLMGEYGEGVAAYDDEIIELISTKNGKDTVIATAEHATDPVRKATGIREAGDYGTAALAAYLGARLAELSVQVMCSR